MTSSTIQERCFEVLYATGDFEMLLLESKILKKKMDITLRTLNFQMFIFKRNAGWGWVDMPDEFFDFSTCDPNNGDMVTYYNERYDLGTNYLDILNYPGQYIDDGDWVAGEGVPINSESDTFDLIIGEQFLIAE